jgi:hypothetical protein
MAIWTFVVEFEGGTYSSQHRADNLEIAIILYNALDPSGCGAVPLDMSAPELDSLTNIYCTSGLSIGSKKLILANIVKTDMSK